MPESRTSEYEEIRRPYHRLHSPDNSLFKKELKRCYEPSCFLITYGGLHSTTNFCRNLRTELSIYYE